MKGDLVKEIRRLAATKKPFSWRSVRGRFADNDTKRMVLDLHHRGEILLLFKGQTGRGGSPAIYRGK